MSEEEKIIEIEIERLRDFPGHPFKVKMDQQMNQLMGSIKFYGIISPLIVRPIPDGVYEIIAGHRRKFAAQQLGYRTNFAKNITAMLRESYGNSVGVMECFIPFSIKVAEASAVGMSVFQYAPKSKAAESFKMLTEEVLRNDD